MTIKLVVFEIFEKYGTENVAESATYADDDCDYEFVTFEEAGLVQGQEEAVERDCQHDETFEKENAVVTVA